MAKRKKRKKPPRLEIGESVFDLDAPGAGSQELAPIDLDISGRKRRRIAPIDLDVSETSRYDNFEYLDLSGESGYDVAALLPALELSLAREEKKGKGKKSKRTAAMIRQFAQAAGRR